MSQLGWLFPIYGKIKMFQTTDQNMVLWYIQIQIKTVHYRHHLTPSAKPGQGSHGLHPWVPGKCRDWNNWSLMDSWLLQTSGPKSMEFALDCDWTVWFIGIILLDDYIYDCNPHIIIFLGSIIPYNKQPRGVLNTAYVAKTIINHPWLGMIPPISCDLGDDLLMIVLPTQHHLGTILSHRILMMDLK